MNYIKPPPYSIDAEQAVLGGILVSGGGSLMEVQDLLVREDFYRADHQILWDMLCQLDELDSPIDIITITEHAKRADLIDEVGGLEYLATLANEIPGAANIRAYAQTVKERSTRRDLIRVSRNLHELAEDSRPIDDVISEAQSQVMEIGHSAMEQGPVDIRKLMPGWIDRLDELSNTDQSIPGLSTGFRDLDRKINGLQKQNLIIIAGRPAMGKTALAINIANHVSALKRVLVFSMEMSSVEIITRSVASYSKVPLDRLMSGNIDEEMWDKVGKAVFSVEFSKLVFDESPALLLNQIRARARRVAQKYNDLGLIVIDYVQLMSGDTNTHRAQQISDITRGLKALAKELDIPVIALSQLNRDVDKRDDKRPRLSDLRESGSIEQDADVIIFVYRDVVYDEKTRWKKAAEIIVGKQRNGPTGTVLLHYFGEYTLFGQMEGNTQQEFWNDRHRASRRRSDPFDDDF